jgi:hypothetical protein
VPDLLEQHRANPLPSPSFIYK